eukprot:scaffold225712_cov32-Tisochrysis_lutea.AAC.3
MSLSKHRDLATAHACTLYLHLQSRLYAYLFTLSTMRALVPCCKQAASRAKVRQGGGWVGVGHACRARLRIPPIPIAVTLVVLGSVPHAPLSNARIVAAHACIAAVRRVFNTSQPL